MKKIVLIAAAVILLAGAAGAAYWYFLKPEAKSTRPKRDPNAWVVPPVQYPMKGRQFVVPDQPDTIVTLDMIAPSTKHDYPMGKYAVASGTSEGQIFAMDDLATALENGLRAVPIVVSGGGSGSFVYLAVVEESGDTFKHTKSLFLGDRIRILTVTRSGNQVTVVYNVHDQNQDMAEVPSLQTTAIVDISNGTFVQEGRKPWLEKLEAPKTFLGEYRWVQTVATNGDVQKPTKTEAFTLKFDGPRIALGTDCNSGSAEVTLPRGSSTALTIGAIAATKMFCESAEEGPYFSMIGLITAYEEVSADELHFILSDGRTMEFKKPGATLEFESSEESPAS
jgi:hypothetical protein